MIRKSLPENMVLSPAQLRDVIDRAARMPAAAEGVTIAELRIIAAELDIDPKAVERALDEVVGLPIAGHPVRTWLKRQLTKIGRQIDQFLPPKGRLVAGGLFGGIAGWLNAFLADGFAVQIHYPIAIAMVGITVANLLSRRLDRSLFKFLAETVATWGLYAVLWAATYGHVTENLVLWVGLWTAAAAITGWMLMRDASTDDHGSGLPAEVPPQIVPDGSSMEGNTDLLRRVMWPAIATGFDECRRAT